MAVSKNVKTALLLLVFSGLFIVKAHAVEPKDPGLAPISEEQLKDLIRQTPLDSPKHTILISRSYYAHLSKFAYEQYTLLWKKSPNDFAANLRRGVAAENYWRYATSPGIHEIPLGAPEDQELEHVIQTCLSAAVRLEPNSAYANSEYGIFVWQYGHDMQGGFAMLKKAERLAPNNPSIHADLGSVYANPASYDPRKAEEELRTAIRLDQSYAYPHFWLTALFISMHRYHEANSELQAYLALAPPGAAKEGWVKWTQSRIDPHLSRG